MTDQSRKPLVWLKGEVKTPPFSTNARIDEDAIIIIEVFNKTTNKTPKKVIEICQKRLKQYDSI
jgi:hypothetical protein